MILKTRVFRTFHFFMFFGNTKERNISSSTANNANKRQLLLKAQQEREKRNRFKTIEKASLLVQAFINNQIIYKEFKPLNLRQRVSSFLLFNPRRKRELEALMCEFESIDGDLLDALCDTTKRYQNDAFIQSEKIITSTAQTGYILKRLLKIVLEQDGCIHYVKFISQLISLSKTNHEVKKILASLFQTRKIIQTLKSHQDLVFDLVYLGNTFFVEEFMVQHQIDELEFDPVFLELVLSSCLYVDPDFKSNPNLASIDNINTAEKFNLLMNLQIVLKQTNLNLHGLYFQLVTLILQSLDQRIFKEYQEDDDMEIEDYTEFELSEKQFGMLHNLYTLETLLLLEKQHLEISCRYLNILLKLFPVENLNITSVVIFNYDNTYIKKQSLYLGQSSASNNDPPSYLTKVMQFSLNNQDCFFLVCCLINRYLRTMTDQEFFEFQVFDKNVLVSFIGLLRVFLTNKGSYLFIFLD